jgi:hypothetical protein
MTLGVRIQKCRHGKRLFGVCYWTGRRVVVQGLLTISDQLGRGQAAFDQESDVGSGQ